MSLFKPFTIMLVQCLSPYPHICNRMQQRFNVLTDIYEIYLLLFYCSILLEIRLTITATAATTTATAATAATTTTTITTIMYTAEYYVICILCVLCHMYIDITPGSVPSKASSPFCLLAEEQTLPYLTGLNWFAILHRFVQFIKLSRQMQPGNFHDLLHMQNSSCKAVGTWINWKCWQKMSPDDSLVIKACIKRNPRRV